MDKWHYRPEEKHVILILGELCLCTVHIYITLYE